MVRHSSRLRSGPPSADGYFQTEFDITPGDYSLIVAVAAGDKSGAAKQVLKVPDYSKLSLSSVILAKKFTQLPDAKPEKEPYTFGKIKLEPTLDRNFSNTDELMVFFEVYSFVAKAPSSFR